MELFKRLPNFHPLPDEQQELVPLSERDNYPNFAREFTILEKELMPHFRELDNEAARQQNRYRWMYTILIFGGALVTILGIIQLMAISLGVGITETSIAAIIGSATVFIYTSHHHKRYFNARLAAELLRGEYFLFLGHLEPYTNEHDRIQNLLQRVADITEKGHHFESA